MDGWMDGWMGGWMNGVLSHIFALTTSVKVELGRGHPGLTR